ncbi:MAG: hypothetical protein JOY94_20415 [Methylobacteriaceae bacterium]|nr:hypothetical protein [Methylobacteriaceae bacterium]
MVRWNVDSGADSLWRSDAGAMAEWLMNGGAITQSLTPSAAGAAANPDATWSKQAKLANG